ncbi:hypothetical protein SERLA73DRAFT_118549 [Serpula lacrymans var. lacrymans S7.3]|uniref:Uncharacterized protein n=1 Tax=Serpula lacrymans var. lacrymans (strain S7.3) TaxID=936435 RepID=F8PH00_SERL3|nr:hypothetical protein SERLA73DRAFT_118549 [Serpula lacrymans var. lacrymans S7.3]
MFSKHQKMCLKGKNFSAEKWRILENNDLSRQIPNDVSRPHMDVDSNNQEGNWEFQTAVMDLWDMAFVGEVDDRSVNLAGFTVASLNNSKIFLPGPLSPLPPHSIITFPLEDDNESHANQASILNCDDAPLSDSTPNTFNLVRQYCGVCLPSHDPDSCDKIEQAGVRKMAAGKSLRIGLS